MHYSNDRTALTRAWTRHLGVMLLCALVLLLLACRLETALSGATAVPTARRAALRPTFTPPPLATDTPEVTPTAVPTETFTPEPPTEVPPTQVPTRRPTARPRPTDTPLPPPTIPPTAPPPPTATVVFQFTPSDQSCTGADGATSDTIKGTIVARNAPAVGQRVRASAGPGGEPMSDDKLTNVNGIYTLIFVCNGGVCNGDFWVWMVNAEGQQTSPYVKFSFNDGCRRGTLNFSK